MRTQAWKERLRNVSVHVRNEMWKTRKQLRNVIKKRGERGRVIVPKKVEK